VNRGKTCRCGMNAEHHASEENVAAAAWQCMSWSPIRVAIVCNQVDGLNVGRTSKIDNVETPDTEGHRAPKRQCTLAWTT